MIKLCVFDLDGTLLNTLPALNKIINLCLKDLGLGEITKEQTKLFVGRAYKNFVDKAIAYFNMTNKIDKEKAYNIYNTYFNLYKTEGVSVYDGILELLRNLKQRDIKIAVLSNKSQLGVEANIKKYFGDEIFDYIYGERKGIRIKPNADALLAIINECGVKKDEVFFIGDTDVDMQTGKNAGVCSIGVLWGFRDRKELLENDAKYIVEKPQDILNLI